MKIGLVCPYNMLRGGGVQECVREMQAELQKRGHDVLIITPNPRSNKSADDTGIVFLGGATDVKSPFHTTAQVSFAASTDALEHLLEDYEFDILHFHEPWVPMLSRQLLTKSSSVNIATFHAKLPDTVMSRTIERVITPYTKSVLKHLDYLTAVSDAAAHYISDLTNEQVNIIPNGIDLNKFSQLKKQYSEFEALTVLYIGRLEKRKGVRYLIKAAAEVQENHPNVRFIIAGDGPDRQRLEQYAEQLEVNNIEFLGFISEEKKLELLARSTVFCSPAVYGESFGIVLLEAMATGTPIVAGDNPGYCSVLKGTGALSIVNPKECSDFARRLELLLMDKGLRKNWQTWAKSYVKQFDYSNVVDAYEALYKKALDD